MRKTKPVYAMIVAAHPDDAEFGAAGTVARWTREGKDVVYVICTNGDKGTSDIDMKPEQLAKIREQEQLAAAKVVGVRETVFLHYPDQGLEDTPELRKDIVRQIRIHRPKIVLTSDPYRRYIWHRDHRIIGQVVMDAIFPYARDIWAYPDFMEQGLKPHKVEEVWCWGSDEPDYCSDITDTFDIKIAALSCHKSQIGDTLRPEVKARVTERAKMVASGENCELGEAFRRVEIWQ